MLTKDKLEILSSINELLGMMGAYYDIIKIECERTEDDGLFIFTENSFDSMYGPILKIKRIVSKPFENL
jgi:hypothetical protein